MENNLSGKLLSEESEDYNIDDIIELHKPDEETDVKEGSSLIKSFDVVNSNTQLESIPNKSQQEQKKNSPALKPLFHPKIISSSQPESNNQKPVQANESSKEELQPNKNVAFGIDNNSLILEDKQYNLMNVDDIDLILKAISGILSDRVSKSVNRFSHMTHSEAELKELYFNLENISKNRGSSKDIIEIGSKIQNVEQQKNDHYISDEDVHKTVEDIALITSVLSKFQSILENNLYK